MNACGIVGVMRGALLGALLSTSGWAQVVISEVNFTPHGAGDDAWIELHNLGPTSQSLKDWSLYYATKTAGKPNTYWWAFPSDAALPAGGFLRVHWYEPVQARTVTDIWTGNSLFHFLFGLGGEPLHKEQGALALIATVDNGSVNERVYFRDWVSWGSHGFARENTAIAAGLWNPLEFAPAPTGAESLALDYAKSADPTPADAWFLDPTPTPLAPNLSGASVSSYGTSCAVGAFGAPRLSVNAPPFAGNGGFSMTVSNTDATKLQYVVLAFSARADRNGTVHNLPIMTCPFWVDLGTLVAFGRPATQNSASTTFPMPLTGASPSPAPIFSQAFVFSTPPLPWDHAATQGLEMTIGR